jgi:calcium-dependent protein kinase
MGSIIDCCPKSKNEESNMTNKNNNNLPQSFIDINDVRTANVIIKREENPWEYYTEIEKLGSGTFGVVKKVKHNASGLIRSIKIIPIKNIRSGMTKEQINNEFQILRHLDHPNIMKIYELYEDKENFYIVSEFCDQGDLFGKLKKLRYMNELVVKFLMMQILGAINYLHSKEVLHGDIKLENILIYTASEKLKKRFTLLSQDDLASQLLNLKKDKLNKKTQEYIDSMHNYEIKVIDFGCSRIFKQNLKLLSIKEEDDILGTSLYCSPEVIDNRYSLKCDEWSCGVLMYILLSGYAPFEGKTEVEIFKKAKRGLFNFYHEGFKNVSENAKDLIKQLLIVETDKRITAENALKHPFFTENFNPSLINLNEKEIDILKQLPQIKEYGKFQQAVISYLTMNFLNKDDEKILRDIFRYIDKSNDNYITKEDLKQCFDEQKIEYNDEVIDKIFKILDSDNNDYIEYQEFIRALVNKEELFSENNLKAAFEFFDEDNSGNVNWNDINTILFQKRGVKEDVIKEYLEEIDMKIEDSMNFEQFKNIMRKCI